MNVIQTVELDIEDAVKDVAKIIGDFFKGEASAAEQVYNTLSDEEKQAQTWGLSVIAIVNANLTNPTGIIPLIEKTFPTLDLSNLQGFLEELLARANGAIKGDVPLTLEDAITQLAAYLETFTVHTFWGQLSQALGNELTIIISPTTVIQKVMATAELVYQIIVKPKVVTLTPVVMAPASNTTTENIS